jgi:hypothetical protein
MKIKVTLRTTGQKNGQIVKDDLCLAFHSTCRLFFGSESNKSYSFLCNAASRLNIVPFLACLHIQLVL